MRWSQAFIPTLREDPADAEAPSHRLLLRAGLIRQLMSGVYSLLPLGLRVASKIEGIIREEMNRIGAQEFSLPALHPAEIWQRSGRWDAVGEELFRLRDRHGTDLCLGMTHEEIFATVAAELRSYKELPQIWYQFQTKFRDEARAKSGLLRVREFVMKDSYSLDLAEDGLDRAFQLHFEAYRRIFERCGLDPIAVEASSGAMGGSESIEFMIPSDACEDWIASCASCGYAANTEKATSTLAPAPDSPALDAAEKFPTPGVRTLDRRPRALSNSGEHGEERAADASAEFGRGVQEGRAAGVPAKAVENRRGKRASSCSFTRPRARASGSPHSSAARWSLSASWAWWRASRATRPSPTTRGQPAVTTRVACSSRDRMVAAPSVPRRTTVAWIRLRRMTRRRSKCSRWACS